MSVDEPKLGYIIVIREGEESSPLPLENTIVSGQIIGPVAEITVSQHFGNPFKTPIELEYLFPLPHEAAIVDYEISIGERTIKAELKEREQAQKVYQEAVSEGKRASLLEQRRPNLFSIQIGNVQPNETIITKLVYEERLHYEDGTYKFIFPMGITPRYHRQDMSHSEAQSLDSPVVEGDEGIAPVQIALDIDTGVSSNEPSSPTHNIDVQRQDDSHFSLKLAEEYIPNKDFVLHYKVAEDDMRVAMWSSDDGDLETQLITLLPPQWNIDAEPEPSEYIFVLDRSGSMQRGPIEQARNALSACIRALGEHDTFMIQNFDTKIEWYADKPQTVNQKNIDKADEWIQSITARGGTEILKAIEAALSIPVDKERQRFIVFLTDGAVSADERAIEKINKQRGDARVFTFGIGPSVNRYLLSKMAQMGRGVAEFMTVKDDIEGKITKFQDRVSYPVLLDIELKWQNAENWDTYPAVLQDLYIGQPLEIVTRLKRTGDTQLVFSGKQRKKAIDFVANIPTPAKPNPTLKRLWARARIEALLDQNSARDEKTREKIISLALEHRIVTQFTSFVAVDSEITDGDEAKKVRVSTPLPEGLEMEGFFGMAGMVGQASVMSLGSLMPSSTKNDISTRLGSFDAAPTRGARHRKAGGSFLSKATPNKLIGKIKDIAGSGSTRFDAGVSSKPSPMPAAQPKKLETIDERIKWLVRTQNVNGSWNDDVEMTAAAIIAFVRAGHTTRVGNYRRQMNKAVRWLQDQYDTLTDTVRFIAFRALDELTQATGHDFITDAQRASLPTPSNDLERATVRQSVNIPAKISSLDDLRLAAIARGGIALPDAFKSKNTQDEIEVWLAIGMV